MPTLSQPTTAASEQPAALAEALRDIAAALNSTLDLDEVLALILNTIGTIVPYDAMDIMLLEGDGVQVVRHIGFAERGLADWITSLRYSLAEVANLRRCTTPVSRYACLTCWPTPAG